MRVNVGVDPKTLTDEHLIAEARELIMLPYFCNKCKETGSMKNIPEKFTLGQGHILFFTNKVKYVCDRYLKILDECKNRNINMVNKSNKFVPLCWEHGGWNNWQPDLNDLNLIISRICDRIQSSPKKEFHYNHKKITKDQAILLIQQNLYY